MRTRNVVAASAVALVLVPAAAACGGSGSANGSSAHATVTSQSGTTSASGSAAGHSFAAQISSLGAVVDRLSSVSGSAGSSQVATDLSRIQRQLDSARGRLATTSFPSAVQPEKQQLMTSLDRWSADLSRAESSARQGNTHQALHQAQSSTYEDLKSLLDTVRSMTG
jgi:cob(I)alamin adenosyltransferase